MVQRTNAIRLLSLALVLAGVFTLLVAFAFAFAVAARAEYGGLGSLVPLTPGRNGGHLEINPRAHHAFGVAPDGSSYIAESIEISGKPYFRLQKLAPQGEYLAEAQVKLPGQAHQLEGVAIDPAAQRIYLLVVGERNAEVEQPVFDPEVPVAAELYAFSTEATAGTLAPVVGTTAGLLADEKALDSLSEAAGVPLLRPHGIAVDPTTHDLLILGQQDVSTKKGLGEESLRAAAQRVHTVGADAGKLGPRYVDTENCLDEGATIAVEPACAEGFGQASSPFVSPGGRLYGERSRELWEIPVAEGVSEAFAPGSSPKVYEVKPKRLFTTGREQGIEGQEGIVEPVSEEEGAGGALTFTPTGPGAGRIYLDAEIIAEEGGGNRSQNRGAVVLDYSESGATPEAEELGWTGGQNATGENAKCILPLGSEQILVGADGSGRLLLFDVTTAVLSEHKPATINVMQFADGGEGCGHAQATPPSVTVAGAAVTKMRLNEKATLSLTVFEADTQHIEWRFKNSGKEEADEQPVVANYPFPTQVPTFEHEFKHAGNYEVIAIVEPDNFGPKLEEHANVTVEGGVIGAEFSYTGATTVGSPAKFSAKVTDPYKASPHPQYKYVWEFGDGAKVEGSGSREFKVEHAYAGEGRYTVKLTVIDEGGRAAEAAHVVQVSAPKPRSNASSSPPGEGGGGGTGSGKGDAGGGAGAASTHVRNATLAGRSLTVSKSGELTLRLACPAGEVSCSGTVTLRTLGAVGTSARAHAKKSVLILAAGSFSVVGGQMQSLRLHLSVRARSLLIRLHSLRARVALLARGGAGATHVTQTVVTLRLAAGSSHLRRR